MSEIFKEKVYQAGITLIALVVTIIILLILAGVSIATFAGENGILTGTKKSIEQSKIAEAEEKAKLILTEYLMDTNFSSNPELEDIIDDMNNEGYTVVTIPDDFSSLTGIVIPDNIFINKNETVSISVSFEGENTTPYVVIDGKYYKVEYNQDGELSISKEATEINFQGKIEATSSANAVKIKEINGNVITLEGVENGTSTITVKYEKDSENTFIDTCNAVVKPDKESTANAEVLFSTEYGRIDIIWLDGTTNTVKSTPNAPVLESENESMTPVVYDENEENKDARWKTADSSSEWYNYSEQKWANAQTKNKSYFVWIPRYAYRITYYDSETDMTPTGYYDGLGMWSAEGKSKYKLDEGIETVEYKGASYIVHPAFATNLDNGGWSTNLSGFWFAKFEMGGTSTALNSTYGTPSISRQTIGEQYTTARTATYGYNGTTDSFDGNTSFMNSHMSKNSEWGAVAYLTHSKYGKNGEEISTNTNSSFYRGGGSGTAYINNTNQSTTGNVYGIYDMSGGSNERTAVFNSVDSEGYFSTYGWTEATKLTTNSDSTKYATKYYNTSGGAYGNEVMYVYGKIGDATKEVNTGGNYSKTSEAAYSNWFSDYPYFILGKYPFTFRGGYYGNEPGTGVFYNHIGTGEPLVYYSFRASLCPEQ